RGCEIRARIGDVYERLGAFWRNGGRDQKSQISNPKSQVPNRAGNLQYFLEFEVWIFFGIWDLDFGILSVCPVSLSSGPNSCANAIFRNQNPSGPGQQLLQMS